MKNLYIIYTLLFLFISNCVPLALDNDKRASESRGTECVQKKNNHLLLCQVAKLGLPLCFVTFPNCYEDASSDEE